LQLGKNNPWQGYRLGTGWPGSNSVENDLDVLVEGKLNVSQECALARKYTDSILGGISSRMASMLREVIISLCKHFLDHNKHAAFSSWTPSRRQTLIKWREFSRGTTAERLEHVPHAELQREWNFFSLDKGRLQLLRGWSQALHSGAC